MNLARCIMPNSICFVINPQFSYCNSNKPGLHPMFLWIYHLAGDEPPFSCFDFPTFPTFRQKSLDFCSIARPLEDLKDLLLHREVGLLSRLSVELCSEAIGAREALEAATQLAVDLLPLPGCAEWRGVIFWNGENRSKLATKKRRTGFCRRFFFRF